MCEKVSYVAPTRKRWTRSMEGHKSQKMSILRKRGEGSVGSQNKSIISVVNSYI